MINKFKNKIYKKIKNMNPINNKIKIYFYKIKKKITIN